MKIPSMLYGRAAAVKSKAKKTLEAVIATREFDRLDCGPFIETKDTEGLLLVQPERFQLPGKHFHCYALTWAIYELIPASEVFATMDAWMRWSLSDAWRLLGALDDRTANALNRERSLLVPYVEAVVRFWPELKAEGKRYGPSLGEPEDVWQVMHNLKFALANLGVPAEQLRTEPPEGPVAFCAELEQGRK
jgi:hypothetical protein